MEKSNFNIEIKCPFCDATAKITDLFLKQINDYETYSGKKVGRECHACGETYNISENIINIEDETN